MLVHPWDAADDDEWRAWLADGRDFGQLVVNDAAGWPRVVPTHFVFDGHDEVLVHLARPNPVWHAVQADPRVVLAVVDDYAFVPGTWRVDEGADVRAGVPTSYYASVQLACEAEVVDDPAQKAELLRRQLAHFAPDGVHGEVDVESGPYARLLPGIRGLRLRVVGVTAKVKVDDRKSREHRVRVGDLLAERDQGRDAGARANLLRRLDRQPVARPR